MGIAAIVGLLALGCGEEKTSSGGVVSLDAGAQMGGTDAAGTDPYVDYCQRVSQAKCDYIFGCVSGGYIIQSLFGLPGSTADRCAERAAVTCLEDIRDRDARGTVDFTESAVDACVQQMSSRPCLPNDPSEWANQWHDFVANFCGGVARGNVQTDEACVRRSDCFGRHDVCISGTCRVAEGRDLLQSCTPEGIAGTLSESDTCPTGYCINTGYGGNCTVDCRTGRGCVGDTVACLSLTVTGGPSSSFCISPCSIDAHCGELACRPIDPMDDTSDTYCVGAEAANPE
jgi:hypothetical protein